MDVAKEDVIWMNELVVLVILPFSVYFDDWGILLHLEWMYWVALIISALVVVSFGDVIQCQAIRVLGAPLVGALQPYRLITATILGVSPLLNENVSYFKLGRHCDCCGVSWIIPLQQYRTLQPRRLEVAVIARGEVINRSSLDSDRSGDE
eukprot:TRINITY_DN9385_c0_g1_i1.p1 TRINITY_DN9385_c0_g1~~TRINITY_DN9385_c0_g1_i1.p1  ORF type:complete len:170 (-),score=8.81 TRINITY_DN9385_c0_g1_i1:23-472(-)